MRGGASLEGEQALKLDAVADVPIGEMAFVDDAAGALNVSASASGKIRGHAKGHGQRRANSQRQRTAHEEAGARDVGSFRCKFRFGYSDFGNAEAKRDLQRLTGAGAFLKFLHGALLARRERSSRRYEFGEGTKG